MEFTQTFTIGPTEWKRLNESSTSHIFIYPDKVIDAPFIGYADPVSLPARPVSAGVAAALVMGAALASPSKLSRRSLLGLALLGRSE